MQDDFIALFELEGGAHGVSISAEKHYRLDLGEQVTEGELKVYRKRQD